MSSISPRLFRTALGNYATGITVITALDVRGDPIGMTANSFASVSLDPPLVLWSVDKSAPEADDFVAAGHYAVHVLRQDQQQLSHTFSDDSVDKFADLRIDRGIGDLPLLTDYSVRLQCATANRYEEGDHVILIGQVLDVQLESADPLVFFDGAYRRLQT